MVVAAGIGIDLCEVGLAEGLGVGAGLLCCVSGFRPSFAEYQYMRNQRSPFTHRLGLLTHVWKIGHFCRRICREDVLRPEVISSCSLSIDVGVLTLNFLLLRLYA